MKIDVENYESFRKLKEIKERLSKTEETEWIAYIEGRDFSSGSSFIMINSDETRINDIEILGATDDELDFIANSKKDIKFLLQEIDKLKRNLKLD